MKNYDIEVCQQFTRAIAQTIKVNGSFDQRFDLEKIGYEVINLYFATFVNNRNQSEGPLELKL